MAWVECWGDDMYECSVCGEFWGDFEEARTCCPYPPKKQSKWADKGIKRLRDES